MSRLPLRPFTDTGAALGPPRLPPIRAWPGTGLTLENTR